MRYDSQFPLRTNKRNNLIFQMHRVEIFISGRIEDRRLDLVCLCLLCIPTFYSGTFAKQQ